VKGILPAYHRFEVGDRLVLFQRGLFSSVEETHASLLGKPSMLEAGTCSSLFHVIIGLDFERNILANHSFQGGDMLCLNEVGLFS
jgi:hypothetical protein